MRAIHTMGNWSGNVEGFKAPLLASAPSLAASNVSIQGNISSFQDGQGVTHSNDIAKVTLRNVAMGNGLTFSTAGFWVFRDLATGAMGLQFRPQLDPNLAGITDAIVVHDGRDWIMVNVGTLRNFLNLAAFAGF